MTGPRVLGLVFVLAGVAGPVFAQERVDPPPPTDFTKPFQLDRSPWYGWGSSLAPKGVQLKAQDGAFVRGKAEDQNLPVEVIGHAELLLGNPAVEDMNRPVAPTRRVGAPTIILRSMNGGRTIETLDGRRLADDPTKSDQKPGAK